MNQQDIVQLLGLLSARNVSVGPKWVKCSCILAPWTHDSGTDSSPSFAIKVDPHGESHYNCYTCGHGDLMELITKLDAMGAQAPKYQVASAAKLVAFEMDGGISLNIKDYGDTLLDDSTLLSPLPESYLDSFVPALTAPVAKEYLYLRGLDDEDIVTLQVLFDPSRMAVVFPIRDFYGILMGARGRYLNPTTGPKYHAYTYKGAYRNKLVWYGEHRVKTENPVVMVESVFDYARVYRYAPNILAPLTVGFSKEKAERMSMIWDIVTLFDAGAGGDRARELVDKYWPDSLKKHLVPPYTRAGLDGTPASDPGNMTDDQLQEYLELGLIN